MSGAGETAAPQPETVSAPLERDTDGTWWYLHVPRHVREVFAAYQRRGVVSVRATIGTTTWDGSLLPWADGSAQLSVNRRIRTAESLDLGDIVVVVLEVRAAHAPNKRG